VNVHGAMLNHSENFPKTFKSSLSLPATIFQMGAKRISRGRRRASSQSEAIPAFPVWKAFVLQFSRETGTEAGIFSGRVEHLSSGRRAQFASSLTSTVESLKNFLRRPAARTRCAF
jgi:hypothetical protein